MTLENSTVTYCSECGRKRTEDELKTNMPCPSCGSTIFGVNLYIEGAPIHLGALNVSVKTKLAFETARWKVIFKEMDLAELRTVCEGSKNKIPDIQTG